MKITLLISILILGLSACKPQVDKQQASQQPVKEITEQDVAILVARCVNALENKKDLEDRFNLVETVSQLCKGLGMRQTKLTAVDASRLSKQGGAYELIGKDSLRVSIWCLDEYLPFSGTEEFIPIVITIENPLRYGNVVPNRYKDAVMEELRKQGWYSVDYERWKLPRRMGV